MTTLTATEARKRFFEILNSVIFTGEEVVIKKENAGSVRMIAEKSHKPSDEEREKIISDLRKVFARSRKRKYWSVLDTPAWKKKESKYLENLSKGIIR